MSVSVNATNPTPLILSSRLYKSYPYVLPTARSIDRPHALRTSTRKTPPPLPSPAMEPAAAAAAGQLDVDKLTYEIFSILESKFLFGYDDPKLVFSGGDEPQGAVKGTLARGPAVVERGKVCVLSIDGGGRAADGLLAGAALVSLEASLRRRTGDETARLADFFDVAAGSGAGGVLAAMLVARGGMGGRCSPPRTRWRSS